MTLISLFLRHFNGRQLASSLQYISFYSDFGTTFIGNSFISSVAPPWQVQPVPEPETWATAVALLLFGLWFWKQQRKGNAAIPQT